MKKKAKVMQWRVESPAGPLFLLASEKGLCGVYWQQQSAPMAKGLGSSSARIRLLRQSAAQMRAYFLGRLKKFRLTLDIDGSVFQRRVWKELARIPYGRTRSYRDIARRIGRPKAVRAVGNANGRNPLCIIVPCHRVIAADGSIGGYSGGLDKKSALLRLEQTSRVREPARVS